MEVTVVFCHKCFNMIFSRTRHDFRSCPCSNVSIDGGFDYTRIVGDTSCKTFKLEIQNTKQELYDDWNLGINKLGIIKVENLNGDS